MEHPIYSFFINYLSDLHIHYVVTDGTGIGLSDLDLGLRNSILKLTETSTQNAIPSIDTQTIYHITDYYECSYSFFKFPDKKQFLFIGPYITTEFSRNDIAVLMKRLAIPEELFSQLQDYYYSLPAIDVKGSFSPLLRHVYAGIFSSELPTIYYLDLKKIESQQKFLETHHFFVPDDAILSMQLLEERYRIEDELLDAITHGNSAKAFSIAESLRNYRLVPRTGDILRDRKNYLLSFNTLLRRTAYVAGVHPFYIDTVSSNYVTLIEKCASDNDAYDISQYLVRSYCDLVQKRSLTSYSEPIRHILVTVDASLTGDLSLKRFASDLFLNTSYLSSLFKKELGMTLTEYVNQNRIAHAKRLLKSTALPIQDIASQSGISDIHYFTRLFRRETGMSPREWRKQ